MIEESLPRVEEELQKRKARAVNRWPSIQSSAFEIASRQRRLRSLQRQMTEAGIGTPRSSDSARQPTGQTSKVRATDLHKPPERREPVSQGQFLAATLERIDAGEFAGELATIRRPGLETVVLKLGQHELVNVCGWKTKTLAKSPQLNRKTIKVLRWLVRNDPGQLELTALGKHLLEIAEGIKNDLLQTGDNTWKIKSSW